MGQYARPPQTEDKGGRLGWPTITRKDLDSLPDEVWLTMARELKLEWRQPQPAVAPPCGSIAGAEA